MTYDAYVDKDVVVEPTGSGLLNGLTFSVKDVFAIQDYVNGAGNPDWLRTHCASKTHATSIQKLVNQGATLKGTTHTDELMFSLQGENYHYGTPVNPVDPERIPGGSSSGSAVAVAAGLVDFALGTDTGGSVRIPSTYCGIYGFRPTHGAVAMDGVIPLAKSFDTVGWMANDPELLKRIGKVLLDDSGQHEEGKFSRLLFGKDLWEVADQETQAMLKAHVPALKKSCQRTEWLSIAEKGIGSWFQTFRTIQGLEIWNEHKEWIQSVKPTFGPTISERFKWTSKLDPNDMEENKVERTKIRVHVADLLKDDGLLVLPTAPGVAPLLNLAGKAVEQRRAKTMQLSCVAGLTGFPQVTIPIATLNGLPIGLSIIANHNQDLNLLHFVSKMMYPKYCK